MRRAILIAAALCCLTANNVNSATYLKDGHELFRDCVILYQFDVNKSHCIGFILGVHDAMAAFPTVCLPGRLNVGDLVELLTQHFVDHAEVRDKPAAVIIFELLKEKFPCN